MTALAHETPTDVELTVLHAVPSQGGPPQEPTPSLSELVACYDGLVRATIRRYRLQDSDLEDVAQTTWMRLLQSLDRMHDTACVPGWLVTTARRESMRLLRHKQREVVVDVEAGPEVEGTRPADPLVEVLDGELVRALHAALADLPEHWRTVLWTLACADGTGYADVAQRTGMPIGSIGPTRRRALTQLRAALAARGLDPLHR